MTLKLRDTVRIAADSDIRPFAKRGTIMAFYDGDMNPCKSRKQAVFAQLKFEDPLDPNVTGVICRLSELDNYAFSAIPPLRFAADLMNRQLKELEHAEVEIEDVFHDQAVDIFDEDGKETDLQASLVDVVKASKAKTQRLLYFVNLKIDRIMAELRDTGVICPECMGEGKTLRTRSCAEDDAPDPDDPSDWDECSRCDGVGYIPADE